MLQTTSFDVTGEPSCHFMPCRSSKTQEVGVSIFQDVAMCGWSLPSASTFVSGSYREYRYVYEELTNSIWGPG